MSSADRPEEPDLWDAAEALEQVVRYFEELEERLEAQSSVPVHLVQTQSAQRASIVISRALEADRERSRAWWHSEPSDIARAFIKLVAAFLAENGLDWGELAEQLHLEPGSFAHLAEIAEEDA